MKSCKLFLFSIFCLFISIQQLFTSNRSVSFDSPINFLSCVVYNDAWYYEGYLQIPVSADLASDKEVIDEALFAAELQTDLLKSEALYNSFPDSLNGKILDTDIARHLYGPYANSIDGRYQYVLSTIMPAACFVDYLFCKRIVELAVKNRNESHCPIHSNVVLLAAGDGSGKTTSIRKLGLLILEEAALIKDSTMSSDFEFHRNMVQETLNLGLNVVIVYVFRPIELALENNIKRAKRIGRVRPLVEIAEAHYRAQQNVLMLSEYFKDQIEVIAIDNSGTFKNIALAKNGIEFLRNPDVLYENQDVVFERAVATYVRLLQREIEIPEFVKNLLEQKLDPFVISDEIRRTTWQ